MFTDHLHILFHTSVHIIKPFFKKKNWVNFFLIELQEIFTHSGYEFAVWFIYIKYLFPLCVLPFHSLNNFFWWIEVLKWQYIQMITFSHYGVFPKENKTLRFKAVLGSWKNEQKERTFIPIYSPLFTEFPLLLTSCIPENWWTNIDTLLLTKVHSLHLHFTLYVVHFFGFDKWIMVFIPHYSIIQSSLTALKISCLSLHLPSQPLITIDLFTVSRMSHIWNVTYLESYRVQPFQTDFFHLSIHI